MNNRKLLYRVLGIATIVMLSFGCGGSSEPTATPTPIPPTAAPVPTLEPDWQYYGKSEDGFAIALPPRWEQIDMDLQTLDASLDAVKEQNPEMAVILEGQARNLVVSGIKFFGFDVSLDAMATGFATNVNVLKQSLGMEMSLDVFAQVSVAQLENMDMILGDVTQRHVNLAAGEGIELKYRMEMNLPDGKAMTLALTQYAVIRGEDAYVITLSTTDDQAGTYAPIFEKIAQSFQLLD
jgi:hypothetical protein